LDESDSEFEGGTMKRREPYVAGASESCDRIVEAATRLFKRTSFDSVSAEEIAREAGVAHGLIFHYFGTKARLYEVVSQIAADNLDRYHIQATQFDGDPIDRVRAFLSSHMDEVAKRKVDYVFHSRGGATPAIQAIWENSRLNAIRLIHGFFGRDQLSEELVLATRAWLGFYDELVLAWVQGTRVSRVGIIETSIQLFHASIAHSGLLRPSDNPRTPD
jgi:AcrR family transcriptional regulator